MRRWVPIFLAVALLMATSTPGSAFDGQRKGFLLGGGLGLGGNSFTQSINGIEADGETEGALVTNFKIGGGVSNQVWLYYTNQVTWFSINNIVGDDVTIASGVGGLGVTWFASPEPKGFFLTGSLGLATWDAPFESGSSQWTSFGFLVGVGYEFAAHWSVDLSGMWGSPETTERGITFKSDIFGFMVTVTGIAY